MLAQFGHGNKQVADETIVGHAFHWNQQFHLNRRSLKNAKPSESSEFLTARAKLPAAPQPGGVRMPPFLQRSASTRRPIRRRLDFLLALGSDCAAAVACSTSASFPSRLSSVVPSLLPGQGYGMRTGVFVHTCEVESHTLSSVFTGSGLVTNASLKKFPAGSPFI